jgi:hypothetical protein
MIGPGGGDTMGVFVSNFNIIITSINSTGAININRRKWRILDNDDVTTTAAAARSKSPKTRTASTG